MSNDALPASELVYKAHVSHPTLSSHLQKLLKGNLIIAEQHGRHRYYRLASKEVADVIEKMGTISPKSEIRSLRQSTHLKQVSFARTCYDHLAGQLGVKLTEVLLNKEVIIKEKEAFIVTKEGERWFLEFGINTKEARHSRRLFAKPCLDWSERHYHIAGWLGSALNNHLTTNHWIEKLGTNRAVSITQEGYIQLKRQLGIVLNETNQLIIK